MASDRFILFAETLEGFIDYTFKVSEDVEKVHLELTRRLTADIDIPQPELHDFLTDPEKVLSTLQVSLK